MRSKKPKIINKGKTWQKKVIERVEAENVKLGHPHGKERFERAINQAKSKKG